MTARDKVVLPWSCEAEQSVLGGLLIAPDAMGRTAEHGLTAGDFYDHRHGTIWAAISDLVARRHPVDVVTVFERLQATGQAEDCGGIAYLNELAQSVASAANIGRYAVIVAGYARKRALAAAADAALALAQGPGDAEDLADQIGTLFAKVKRSGTYGTAQPLGVLLTARLGHWQALADGEITGGIPTGLGSLDNVLSGGLRQGALIVLAARPSVGKTSLAGTIGLHVAQQGKPVLMLSQEMTTGDLVDRFAANLGTVRLDRIITGRFEGDDLSRVLDATEAVTTTPFFIDDQPALTLLAVRAKARQVQQRHGLSLLVVDYLQLCAGSAGPAQNRNLQVEEISRGLKALAKELGCTVLALSQLNRNAAEREPELSDLRDSGAIEQDADTVLMLHPWSDDGDGRITVLCKVPKNRQGQRGRLALSFVGSSQRWAVSSANVSLRAGTTS